MSARKKSRTSPYTRQLQRWIDEYVAETGRDVIDMRLVASWAINRGLWQPPRRAEIDILSRDLSRAAREEYIEDEQGNPVRKMHCYRIKQGDQQLTFWVEIDKAKPGQMKLSVQQRRLGIVGDCIQLKTDVSYWNGHHPDAKPIPLSLDFTNDAVEKNLPTEYPDAPPEDDEDSDDTVV